MFFSRDSEAGRTVAGVLTVMRPTSLDIRKRAQLKAKEERSWTPVKPSRALAAAGSSGMGCPGPLAPSG